MRGPTSSAARRSLLARPTTLAPATRLASTLPSSSSAPARPPSPAAAANPLRTLLSETALALSHVDELTKADSAWQRRLERALTRLDDRVERDRPRIVLGPARHAANRPGQVSPLKREVTVYGAPLTGADEVLLALLEDPLADESTDVQRAAVVEMIIRPAKAEAVSIEYGTAPSPTASGSSFRLASSAPFLQTSPALELVYLPPSTQPVKALVSLLLAPAPVLVLDSLRLLGPLTNPSASASGASFGGPAPKADASVLQALLRHPNLKVVVNRVGGRSTSSSLATDGPTKAELSRFATEVGQLVGFEPDAMRRFAAAGVVTWVDVGLASEGYEAWRRSGLASSAAGPRAAEEKARELSEFTDKVVGSNIAALQFTLANPSSPTAAPFAEEAAVLPFLVDLALDSARFDLLAFDNYLQKWSLAAKALAANAAQLATQFFVKALAVPPKVGVIGAGHADGKGGQVASGAERRVSEEVVGDVRAAVSIVLARFGWLGMAAKGRVDDVGQEVGDAIRIGWGGEGERLLIFQTGVLSVLQQSLASSLNRTLSTPPHPSLHSAVLVNDLPRLPPITPGLLLGPVQGRLSQLLSAQGGPVSILQLRAQNAVRAAYAISATSLGGGYAGWFAELASAEGAVAVGALGTALGLRFGMARWEKAKRKFWLDFDRIQDGLEEDLQKNTHEIVSDALLARPRVAVEGMEALVVKRRSDLERRVEEIERLRARLATLPAAQ